MPDNCAICHEELNQSNDNYTLPECNHNFHTNCIMTWFRLKHNNCPLCNNSGVNNNYWSKLSHMDEYIKLRRLSRKKDAPQALKKQVEKLKTLEEKYKKITNEMKEFKKSKSEETVNEIIKKFQKLRRDKMILRRRIHTSKLKIGSTNVQTIIIPVKQFLD